MENIEYKGNCRMKKKKEKYKIQMENIEYK
jgi:hypothetical protein